MSESPDPADGLGRSSAGTPAFAEPTFAPPPPPGARTDAARPARTGPAALGPAPTGPGRTPRWPTVLVTTVVSLVVVVTTVATLVARHADTHVAAPPARSVPATSRSAPASEPDRINFTSARGTGRLVVRDRSWKAGRPDRLRISVELTCTTGTVDHAPGSFQLFDADGTPVQPLPISAGPEQIGFGTLGPGEQVRGDVVFEVARQVVTLVLSDDAGSVTALRIRD